MQLHETMPDVFYAAGQRIGLDRASLDFLKERAAASARGQCRICLHKAPDATVHEMVIAQRRGFYSRPHRHLQKTEAFLLIEGEVDLIRFDDGGAISEIIQMGPPGVGVYYHRVPPLTWHCLNIRSEFVIFHETAEGPFDPAATVFPTWAPEPGDATRAAEFTGAVARSIANRMGRQPS